jgi:hypothetical protein
LVYFVKIPAKPYSFISQNFSLTVLLPLSYFTDEKERVYGVVFGFDLGLE